MILRGAFVAVVLAVLAAGVLVWRGMLHLPGHGPQVAAATAKKPGPKATRAPFVPPANAPKFDPAQDPDAIDPFVVRLAKVNALAHRMIVQNAEYHDSDGGTRYFIGVVASCKELNALWPIKSGVLASKVEDPLQLKNDFATFTFGEYQSAGQWGVVSCDGTI